METSGTLIMKKLDTNGYTFIEVVIVSVLLAAICFAGYLAYRNHQNQTSGGVTSGTPSVTTPAPSGTPITASGVVACAPKSGNGPQTMECGIALQTDKGYYNLGSDNTDLTIKMSQTGKRITVTGTLTSPVGSATLGLIHVTSVQDK